MVPDFCRDRGRSPLDPGRGRGIGQEDPPGTSLADRLGSIGSDWVEFLPPFVTMPALFRLSDPRKPGSEPVRDAIGPGSGAGYPRRGSASLMAPMPGRSPPTGLPSLVIGPGDIAQAHTKDEWVDLEEVKTAVDVYFEIARSLGSS